MQKRVSHKGDVKYNRFELILMGDKEYSTINFVEAGNNKQFCRCAELGLWIVGLRKSVNLLWNTESPGAAQSEKPYRSLQNRPFCCQYTTSHWEAAYLVLYGELVLMFLLKSTANTGLIEWSLSAFLPQCCFSLKAKTCWNNWDSGFLYLVFIRKLGQ